MISVDIIFAAVSFGTAPFLLLTMRAKYRAFIWSTMIFWLAMVIAGQYHLAYTPEYNSFAPALSIIVGWFPASIYSGIWLAIALSIEFFKFKAFKTKKPAKRGL